MGERRIEEKGEKEFRERGKCFLINHMSDLLALIVRRRKRKVYYTKNYPEAQKPLKKG